MILRIDGFSLAINVGAYMHTHQATKSSLLLRKQASPNLHLKDSPASQRFHKVK